MNLPNKLTVLRIGLAFLMTAFLTLSWIPFGTTLGLVVFIVASITDYWDGVLARTRYGVTAFGQLMDPLADKILISAAFISFASAGETVPAWVVVTIVCREFLITGLRLLAASEGVIIPAGTLGKQKTVWQIVVVIVIGVGLALRDDILPALARAGIDVPFMETFFGQWFVVIARTISVLVAMLTVVSGCVYLWRSRDLYVKGM
jgi:CDP-diacylglycerol--glycerol-3-phosphate 3-phosphatidyltransferase